MTLKEILMQELETADDAVIAETIEWIRSRKQSTRTEPIPTGEPILRGAKLEDLLEFAGTWAGDDLENCLNTIDATNITLTPEQASFIEDSAWIDSTRQKVDAAIQSLEQNGGTDGETVVNRLLERFRQAQQIQQ